MYKEPKKNRIYQIKKQFELEVYIFNENPLVDWKNLAFTFFFPASSFNFLLPLTR